MEAVQLGVVERWVDESTRLEIFNRTGLKQHSPTSPEGVCSVAEGVCRGLILDPASQSVVATPFTRFSHAQRFDTCINCGQDCIKPDGQTHKANSPTPTSCGVCGCSAPFDEFGDKICGCDTCCGGGRSCLDYPFFAPVYQTRSAHRYCWVCGCSAPFDEFGDRICWCDTCFGGDRSCSWGVSSSSKGMPAVKEIKAVFKLCPGCCSRGSQEAWLPAEESLPEQLSTQAQPATEAQLSAAGPESAADESPCDESPRDNSPVRLSFKVDGSLAIVFVWEGKLRVSTRRRMDSEQALWAESWLQANSAVSEFQPGWTYLFEVVCKVNTLVIAYPFESLVLLEAVSPSGFELSSSQERALLAKRLHVIAVPELVGPASHILPFVMKDSVAGVITSPLAAARNVPLDAESLRMQASTAPTSEGWVMLCQDGSRVKLVKDSFLQLHSRVQWLHPLVVWECLYRGMSREMLLDGLPVHMRTELVTMLSALESAFTIVVEQLERSKQRQVSEQSQPVMSVSLGSSASLQVSVDPLAHGSGPAGANTAVASEITDLQNLTLSYDSSSRKVDSHQAASFITNHSGTSASCTSQHAMMEKADLLGSIQFRKAAAYFASPLADPIHSTPQSMYKPVSDFRKFTFSSKLHLHCLVLECIRPSMDGSMFAYSPSLNFAQTWTKGWGLGPQVGRFSPSNSLLDTLPQALLSEVLGKLGGADFAHASTTCKLWAATSHAHPEFADKCSAGRKEAEDEKQRFRRRSSLSGSMFHTFDHEYDRRSGYGSN